MYYLINPARKRKARKAKARKRTSLKRKANGQFVKRAKAARRRVRRTKAGAKEGGTMARRRRRRSTVRHTAPRRRRRRRSVVVLRSNPRRRRRRTAVARRVHHRRRYRRNPGGGSGIVATIKQGAMDGALVLVGQTAQGRASALVSKMVPVGGLPGAILADIGSAVAVTMLARKFLPGRARMVSAGAFANAVRRTVSAVSPGVGAMLGDGDGYMSLPMEYYDQGGGVGAYPDQMGAYPGGGLGDAEDFSNTIVN
jgi:hypothetical protein